MTEVFDAITVEAQLNGTWTNITTDVLHSPPPRVMGMGIMGTNISKRVGDAARFEFSLDNSASNSGGTLGWYSPGGVNARSGWQEGIPVRLSFTYDGYTRYKFYGYIDQDGGITPETMKYRGRTVKVKASNWMRNAAEHKLNLLQYQTNFRLDNAIQCIIDNMAREPLNIEWHQGQITFPTVFDVTDTNAKALGEINKLTMSEFGNVYIKGDDTGGETLVVEDRNWRSARGAAQSEDFFGEIIPVKNSDITDTLLQEDGTSTILLETGDTLLLENNQFANFGEGDILNLSTSHGKNILTRAKFSVYPRSVGTATVTLYSLDSPIAVAGTETLTNIRGTYKDPNNNNVEIRGYQMVLPVANTDYKFWTNSDATGTDLTAVVIVTPIYGTSEVQYTLQNASSTAGYFTTLTARGKAISVYDPIDKVFEDTGAIAAYGIKEQTFNTPYLNTLDQLLAYSGKTDSGIFASGGFFQFESVPRLEVDSIEIQVNRSSKSMLAFLFCDPGAYMVINETMSAASSSQDTYTTGTGAAWIVQGMDFEIQHMKYVNWKPLLKRAQRR